MFTNPQPVNRIFFFGSFNPPHAAHLMLAEAALNYVEGTKKADGHLLISGKSSAGRFVTGSKSWQSQVVFVVSPQNPLKKNHNLAPDKMRLKMVRKAVRKNRRFCVSDIEFGLEKPVYTADTVRKLSALHKASDNFLLIGEDNLMIFDLWKDYRYILDTWTILVYRRSFAGGSKERIEEKVRALMGDVRVIDAPPWNLSSTYIRTLVEQGLSVRYLVPQSVCHFMKKKRLYVKGKS